MGCKRSLVLEMEVRVSVVWDVKQINDDRSKFMVNAII